MRQQGDPKTGTSGGAYEPEADPGRAADAVNARMFAVSSPQAQPGRRRTDRQQNETQRMSDASCYVTGTGTKAYGKFGQGYAAYRSGDVYHVAYSRAVNEGLVPGSPEYRAFILGFFEALKADRYQAGDTFLGSHV